MVFVIIILLLYVFFLCVPAFFLVYEHSQSIDAFDGCWMTIIGILGFPGAIVAYLMKADKDAKDQAMRNENIRRNEIAAKQYNQELTNQRKIRIEYYMKSPLLPEIINFVTQYSTPYSIHICSDRINVERLNGYDTYYFSKHGINNIPGDHVEPYSLAQAINIRLGNQFTLREQRHENNWGPDEFSVIMERPLKNF